MDREKDLGVVFFSWPYGWYKGGVNWYSLVGLGIRTGYNIMLDMGLGWYLGYCM